MSYILDALKKAESERQLGSVPGVHATPQDGGSRHEGTPFWRKNLPWLLVVLLGLSLLGYVLWSQPWAGTPPPVAAVLQAPVTAPVEAPAATTPPVAPATIEGEPSTAPSAAATPQPTAVVPATIAPAPKITPAVDAPVTKAPEKPPVERHAKAEEAKNVVKNVATNALTPAASAPDSAKSDEQTIGNAQDLPPNIQRELPQISVNGYIYAKNPDDRSVLMNRKLLREGDSVAPDLVLEKLLPKGAILNYKGYRYHVAF